MNKFQVNDLLGYGYKICQNDNYFKFSLDSILLAEFIKIDYKDKLAIDLCTGNAPIPLVLSKHQKLSIYGIEIQKEIFDLAVETIKINKIKNVKILNEDIKQCENYFPGNNFDLVVCNPPYFKHNKTSIINNEEVKAIARHEIMITLEEIIKISSNLLKSSGKLYIVYRTERLKELFSLLEKYKFGIKRMQCAYPNMNSNCNLVMIEAKKNQKDNIVITNPIITNI